MTKPRAVFLLLLGLSSLASAGSARAEKLVPAYDPAIHIRPPTMKSLDGTSSELLFDAEVLEAARRYRAENPQAMLAAPGAIGAIGEIILIQGQAGETVTPMGGGWALDMGGIMAITKKVIDNFGDHFQAITIWMMFEDQLSRNAEAFEVPVKNEVEGLGKLTVMDRSPLFGSNGVLRSVLNMKTVGLARMDTMDAWRSALETWGQESAHRWAMFFELIDPRSGQRSEALLGRQCSHYSRFVESQASIHDGFSWRDNGDGSFTWTEASKRYGNLDLYAMGLMPADEVPPFFLIDGVTGYTYPPSCRNYNFQISTPRTVRGTRVDLVIEDIIAANGARKVPTGERQDYWREAQVVLTRPDQEFSDPRVQELVARIEKARGYWETWNLEASRNRLVICTKVSADCGDARSDVGEMKFNAAGKGPQSGPLNLDVAVVNDGVRAATGVEVSIEARVGEREPISESKELGMVQPGATRTQTFKLDLKGVACGTELAVTARTQSDFHYNRSIARFLVGTEDKVSDGFEEDGDWTVNPDGDDSQTAATWERGTPEASTIFRQEVQPGSAHGGAGAWVTGLAAVSTSARATLVREGKATLQSPLYDTKGLRDPLLRYWVSFAGVVAGAMVLEPSELSSLVVEARAGEDGEWTELERLAKAISPAWAQRSVAIPKELLDKGKIQLRFVATDANAAQGGVEVAIDDLTITSNLAACYEAGGGGGTGGDPGGCDCQVGGRGSSAGAGVLLLIAAALLRRRRR